MKNICKKTITFSIILLLIGVSVSSAISIDTKSTITNNESVEDCNCKEIDSRHLVRLERQLNRLEVYSKLLLVLSSYNSELREISEELYDLINSDSPWIFPIICGILLKILTKFDKMMEYLWELWLVYGNVIAMRISSILSYVSIILYTKGGDLNCDWYEPLPPPKQIFTYKKPYPSLAFRINST